MNIKEIKELLKALDETDISELNVESDGVKISIRKGFSGSQLVQQPAAPQATPAVAAPIAQPQTNQAEAPVVSTQKPEVVPESNVLEGLVPVLAPMVGTFYLAPVPDAPPYVKIGDKVTDGQTVCIIEAMKLMNEIEAEVAGEIIDIMVENGEPVEYGQTLFLIDPAKK